jgi:hypothetical protein
MKEGILKSVFILVLMICISNGLFAQTSGTLTFSFTQIAQSPSYSGTRNALAAWIQTGSGAGGTFVKTKLRYAGAGQGTSDHLPTFSVAAGGTSTNCMATTVNITDATTGATLSSFGARSFTWDGNNVSGTTNGTTVADGTYSVAIQETWDHGTTGTVTNYFAFTKGPTAVNTTFPNTAQFSNITLVWTPAVTNTITTGTISGSSFCAGQTGISIPFTASGTFTSGNVFTAQLSGSTGSFTSPTTIGTLSSTATSGTITSSVALPNTPGTAYRIRVISSTPAATGTDNGANLTISATPTVSNAGPAQSVCTTASATLAGNTPSAGTGAWTLVGGAGTITTPSSAASTVTGLGIGANTFRWTISSGSCTPSTNDVIITGIAPPTVANAGPDQSACITSATLAGNTPSTGTGAWSLISGAGSITTPSSPNTTVTGLGVGANTFRWTISNGVCAASTDNVIITGIALPTTANAGPDQSVCTSSPATMAGNAPSTGTGAWSLISGSGTITTVSSPATTISGLGVGANTFRWTISNGTCTPSTDDVIITGLAAPTTSNAGPDQSVCTTSSATLSGNNPASGTGIWTLISGVGTITSASNPATTITGLGAGANTFRWTISNGTCTPSTDDVIITGVAVPTTANAGPDQTACATSATLAGNTPASGTGVWSLVSGTGTITTPSNPSSTVTGLAAGANTYRWTITNGTCAPSTDDVIITQAGTITTANAGPDQNICGTSATLAGNVPTTGTGAWSLLNGSGTITASSNAASTVTGLGTGANTFRWTISNGACTPSTDDVIINGFALPTTANAGPDQTSCATSAVLAGNTPTTGSGMWTLVGGTGVISSPSSPSSTVTGLGVGTNTFRWTVSNGPCTASTDDIIITQAGTITTSNAGPDQNICGNSATLAGNAPSTGTGAWTLVSGAGTIANTSVNSSAVTGLGAGANTFRWTISNGACTPSTDDVIITSYTAPTTANAGPDQNVCITSSATMSANVPASGSGLWSLVSGSGTISTVSGAGTTITGLGVGVNTFRWTISNGTCTPSTDDVIITGIDAPSIANAGPDQSACVTSATMAGNSPAVGSGLWTRISGSGTCTNTSSPVSTVTGLGVGANTFRWTISNGTCTPNSDDVIITGIASPSTANAGPDQSLCATSAVLAGNSAAVGTGAWSLISGAGSITNSSNPASAITGLGVGPNTFRWTISNGTCAPSTDDVVITGVASPTTSNAGPAQSGCITSATIAANAPSTGSGLWTLVSGVGTITSPSSPSTTVTGLGAGANTFRWTISNGTCTPSVSDVIITQNCPVSITVGSVSGSPFCSSTSYAVSVPFTYTGTLSGTYIAELSDAGGIFNNPVAIGSGSSSPIATVIPSGTASGNGYRIRVRNTAPSTISADNGSDLQINTCLSIVTGAVTGSPFCSNSSFDMSVPFTTSGGTFTGSFIAELSNSSGSFTFPTTIGYGSSSPISATIPSGMFTGNLYRVRVTNSSMNINGSDNGTDLLINTCSGVSTGVMGYSALEGVNVYPNPNQGNFLMSTNGLDGKIDIEITSALGELIYKKDGITSSGTSISIEIPYAKAGMYFIKIQTPTKMGIKKFAVD